MNVLAQDLLHFLSQLRASLNTGYISITYAKCSIVGIPSAMSKVKGNNLGTKFVLVVNGVHSYVAHKHWCGYMVSSWGKLVETETAGSHHSLILQEHIAIVKINMVPLLIIITKRL